MDTRWSRVAVFAATMLVSAVAAGEPQKSGQGAHLFHQYCASCHGEKATGNGPVAPYLIVKPADLTRIAERKGGDFPDEQIQRIIAGEENPAGHGIRSMPVWGERLQDDVIGEVNKPTVARGRIAFLVDYLKAIQGAADKMEFENTVIPGSGPRPGLPRPGLPPGR